MFTLIGLATASAMNVGVYFNKPHGWALLTAIVWITAFVHALIRVNRSRALEKTTDAPGQQPLGSDRTTL